MDMQKVYVRHDSTAVVNCPNCGTEKTINTAKLEKRGKPFKLRCTCRSVFRVFFEFRKAYRKRTNLEGYYTPISESKQWGKIHLENISLTGIEFVTLHMNRLKEGDEIKVAFTLDDKRHSKIEKNAVVRWVKDKHIGCQFTETDQYDKVLGFYLM